jgi:hypothetical protein
MTELTPAIVSPVLPLPLPGEGWDGGIGFHIDACPHPDPPPEGRNSA